MPSDWNCGAIVFSEGKGARQLVAEAVESIAVQTGEINDLPSLMLQLSLARGLDDIMEVVRVGARRLTGADGVTFVLRDGDKCFYADEEAISPLWKGQRFPAITCISGWAMMNRVPAVIEDIFEDSRIPHEAYRLTFVKSLIMVPVRTEDPVAAIGAYWATKRKATGSEVELMQTIANAAAVAMTNVALLHSLQQRAADAERAQVQLERANQHKSRFLAACSHDLSQPFQAMRLFHAVLAGRVGESERVIIDRLGEAMSHGEDLLKALLDVSTIESGLTQIAPAAIPLQDVFDRVEIMFAGQAAARGLRLSITPTRLRIVSDPILLMRILSNLVANALKYTQAGRVLLGVRRQGTRLSIQVWDSGEGIAPEHLDDIFDDFYQVANSERDKRHGIGLGLGIVRRLAEMLNHPVQVRSRLGEGSVFSVTVPLAMDSEGEE